MCQCPEHPRWSGFLWRKDQEVSDVDPAALASCGVRVCICFTEGEVPCSFWQGHSFWVIYCSFSSLFTLSLPVFGLWTFCQFPPWWQLQDAHSGREGKKTEQSQTPSVTEKRTTRWIHRWLFFRKTIDHLERHPSSAMALDTEVTSSIRWGW